MADNHLDRLIKLALDEDLGAAGDVTTQAVVPPDALGQGIFRVKEPAVVSGTEAVDRVFARVDSKVQVSGRYGDGDSVEAGTSLGIAQGRLRSLLIAERTALNFLQRLCGIASQTRAAADLLAGTACRLLDTRKTAPGMSGLEKAAVRSSGGSNHRFGLFDGILIKDNHISAVGSLRTAVGRARTRAHGLLRVEVEVGSLEELDEALEAGADLVMLDNFEPRDLARAVERCAGKAKVEVSGGVTLDRLKEIARSGADYVSFGRSPTRLAPSTSASRSSRRRGRPAPATTEARRRCRCECAHRASAWTMSASSST